MFNLFKKKSPIDRLYNQYEFLLKEAHKLSKTDRLASDKKMAEANEIIKKIDALKEAEQ